MYKDYTRNESLRFWSRIGSSPCFLPFHVDGSHTPGGDDERHPECHYPGDVVPEEEPAEKCGERNRRETEAGREKHIPRGVGAGCAELCQCRSDGDP